MDDDDWGLSFEELDSLERDAAAQLASRNKPTSSAAAPIVLNLDSLKKSSLDADVSKSSGSPLKNLHAYSRIHMSPVKKTGRELKVNVFRDEPGRIAVESPYHPDMVAVLRSISGKRWDQPRKVWTYPEGELDAVLRAISSISRLQIIADVEPTLSACSAGLFEGPRAERKDLQEDETEVLSTPPQPMSSQGSHDKDVQRLESPEGMQHQSPENGAWKCPKNSKSQSSQDGGSNQLPCKVCAVSLLLHSSGKIGAKFEYDPELIASFRKIQKAEWYAKERLWMFPFSSLLQAEKILSSISNRSVKVEPLVPLVKRALEATAALPDLQERYNCIPEVLRKTLMDFQVDGVRFSLQHGGRALIADEMGLGKTLQALAVVSCFKEDWPVLIIVPSSLRLNWATMLEKWLQIHPSDITIVMSQGSSREGFKIVRTAGKKKVCLDGLFNIVSYDVLTKLEETIFIADFKIVIADESHYMKNPNAKRTNACVPVLQKAKYALLLTGTPALSRPIEMFKQLEALQPSVYRKVDEYGRRYCMGGFFGIWQGASNHDELHALVKSTVMIRRLKKDVMKQLPKKRREQVFISLDDHGARQLHELFKELESAKTEHRVALGQKDTDECNRLNFVERQLLAKIYTESAEAKLPAVQDYLTTVLEAGCKFLVFGHHQSMLDGIQDLLQAQCGTMTNLLQKKKVPFIRIDGKTSASSRLDLVRKFQEESGVLVALLGIRAAGVGLTLTAASTVIFAEMSWTPGDLVQAEDRVHRIGQESAVNIYYLHANGSIDDLIWDAVQHKLENLGQVLDGDGDSSMKVASSGIELGGTSQGQETSAAYMRPCVNSSASSGNRAVYSHVAEIMTSSQAQATLDAFLRPFEMGKVSPDKRVSASRVESVPMPRTLSEGSVNVNNHSSKRKVAYGRPSCSQTGDEMIDLQGDIPEVGQRSFKFMPSSTGPGIMDAPDDILEEGYLGSELVPGGFSDSRFRQYGPSKKGRRMS